MPAIFSAKASLLSLALLSAIHAPACQAAAGAGNGPSRTLPAVHLAAASGWTARQLMPRTEVAVTRVAVIDIFPDRPDPAIVALDELGRCWIIAREQDGWSARETVHDRGGLTALARGDIDPRTPGSETFMGGSAGNLYLFGSHPQGAFDARLIAQFPGVEIHTVLAGDLDPFSKGDELLVFTQPRGASRVRADGPHGTFTSEPVHGLDVGVRDALLLPFEVGQLPVFATASASGRVELSSLTPDGPERSILFDGASGVARLARAPARFGRGPILYSCLDDGRILRHQRRAEGEWITETLHAGAAGPLGLVAGNFDPDPTVESLAVFTADGAVSLLSRHADRWSTRTIFEDLGSAAWLAAGELDGNNSTDELLACGAAGRVVLLSRTASDPGQPRSAP